MNDAMLSGTGTIVLGEFGVRAQVNTSPGATITQAAGHTIRGIGQLNAQIINNGRVEGDSATQLLEFNGFLAGTGTIRDVRIDGIHSPGVGAAAVNAEGVYSIANSGILEIDIGGAMPGTGYDVVNAAGQVNLDGKLRVRSINAGTGIFTPAVGQQFTVLSSANTINGAFDTTITTSVVSGTLVEWQVQQSASSVTLQATALTELLAGDYNGNGVVDAADYVVWRDTLGSIYLEGDGDRNGTVDANDYAVWRANFGRVTGATAGSPSSASVPEPPSLLLLLLAGVLSKPFIRAPRRDDWSSPLSA
jgi:hypothetical protein